MTNQEIVDLVDDALPPQLSVKEKILDAVWQICNDELGMDLEVGGKG